MTYTVRVCLAQRDDWFFANSPDMAGLFVADSDLGVVYKEIPEAIKLLFKAKMNLDVNVKESASPEKRPLKEIHYTADAA